MRVAVIGAGPMGSWFARRFRELGREVKVYDKDLSRARALEDYGVGVCGSLEDAVTSVDAVLLAVPISVVPTLVKDAGARMRGGVLAEVSSLKLPVISSLRDVPRHVIPLSVHPLFGPSEPRLEGSRFALIPVRSLEEEVKAAENLFPGASFIEVEAERHDRVMSYVLSLTHIVALASALAIPEELRRDSIKLSGTSFRTLIKLMEATLTESPQTFTQLLTQNRWTGDVLDRVRKGLERIGEAVKRGGLEDLLREGLGFLREAEET